MRINEFTQNKLSEAPKYKLNKDGTYTLIKARTLGMTF